MGLSRSRPSQEILSGDSADIYFARAESILAEEGLAHGTWTHLVVRIGVVNGDHAHLGGSVMAARIGAECGVDPPGPCGSAV